MSGGKDCLSLYHSMRSFFPFELLHVLHAQTRLSEISVPPFIRGIIWSIEISVSAPQ